jgi:N6-adenosine-specific RNA methylase IME4
MRKLVIKPFSVVVADPPWQFGDSLPGKSRGASKNYKTLGLTDLQGFLRQTKMPIADDAVLFLWGVEAMPREALDVIDAWGFTPKAAMVWAKLTSASPCNADGSFPEGGKLHFGMGRSVRNCHERCSIAKRGKLERLSGSVRSVFFAPVGEHSQKPEVFFDLVEKLYPGPYLELFARRKRAGWTCLGDEVPR